MKPMLAKTYDDQNPKGWLMSEKLDGVRAIWTGTGFISRNGKPFAVAEWFMDGLPRDVVLDGELYMGRGMFQKTAGAVRKKTPVEDEWLAISYFVFDAPEAVGGFERRMALCSEITDNCQFAYAVEQTVCEGRNHLERFARELTDRGAEGVMLREPGSRYENKRSASLLKYKYFETDEAEVIGFEDGKGRNTGVVGALVCRWKKIVFNVGAGLSDDDRRDPPRLGSKITFSFCGLTDGMVPRFPVFVGARDYE